jgi:nicotinamidase-related amidase
MPFSLDLDKLIDRKCRVAPKIDLARTWLHVTDMQVTCTDPNASGYLKGGHGIPSGDECVASCNAVIDRCHEEGVGVSWSMFGVEADGSDAGLFLDKVRFWYPNGGSDAKWGDAESEIDPRMHRKPDEPVFRRPVPSAFYGTLLERFLTSNRIEYLIVVGLSTSYCVRNTAIDASNHNFRPIVLADCTTAYDPYGETGGFVEALRNVQGQYGDVITSTELFAMFDEAKHTRPITGSRVTDQ